MGHEGEGGNEGLFGLAGRRLLLVEDNEDCAEAVRRWLEICGATVTTVGTVRSALARMRAEAPDLVLVDVYLPDGTGWDLVERARRTLPEGARVPVVAISASRTESLQDAAHVHGVRHVIAKPIAPEALAAALTDCLAAAA